MILLALCLQKVFSLKGEGELSVVINNTLLTVRRGDNFYVPPETTYSLINLSEQRAELYLVQYKYVEIKNKQNNEL